MGSSRLAMKLIDPLFNPLRQVLVMAWVPLAIVWFGLGEGPTIFLIALVSTFPVLLSTVAGWIRCCCTPADSLFAGSKGYARMGLNMATVIKADIHRAIVETHATFSL